MATTLRNQILDNMLSTLQGVSIINGYNTDVVKVSRKETTGATDEMPVVYILEPVEEKTPGPNFFVSVLMTTKLRLYMVSDNDDPNEDLAVFVADVEKALLVDTTRNSNAIDTRIAKNNAIVTEDFRVVGAELDVLIRYRHRYDDPTARR